MPTSRARFPPLSWCWWTQDDSCDRNARRPSSRQTARSSWASSTSYRTRSTAVTEPRALHGSPHAGNWLRTAQGVLLLDFETACRGPLEWDVAALDDAAVRTFNEFD